MNLVKLSLLLGGMALFVLAPGSSAPQHAPATTALGAAGAPTMIENKAAKGSGSGDKEIKRTEAATQNILGSGPAAPPAKKGRATLSGPYSCDIVFDNHTQYLIRVFVDGNYYGTMAAWGDFTVYNVGTGPTRLYGRADFSNTSEFYYWGPSTVTCDPYSRYTWRLYL